MMSEVYCYGDNVIIGELNEGIVVHGRDVSIYLPYIYIPERIWTMLQSLRLANLVLDGLHMEQTFLKVHGEINASSGLAEIRGTAGLSLVASGTDAIRAQHRESTLPAPSQFC